MAAEGKTKREWDALTGGWIEVEMLPTDACPPTRRARYDARAFYVVTKAGVAELIAAGVTGAALLLALEVLRHARIGKGALRVTAVEAEAVGLTTRMARRHAVGVLVESGLFVHKAGSGSKGAVQIAPAPGVLQRIWRA